MKKITLILLGLLLFNCKGPEPRRAIKQSSGSIIKESVARNKRLLQEEEKLFQEIIAKDTTNTYLHSDTGSWYFYNVKDTTNYYTAKPKDLVTMTYTILSTNNDTIYSYKEIDTIKYKVDLQELFPGLRHSVKLLKENETATFLYPSSLGYGYHGDTKKIGVNVPLKATISILKIEKENK
ncbi:gliding motility-associated peptidyl-prolyl isomerase GldI [uncultured Maribacter sp.]|uniref:gliding motility-associated peptidyl-prolyl isomerase GldI n=1 Tax=uncultured Maribacter sp. TaxID=431308 RepID=UPI00260A6415|nr:gliding motility-associated peptidyl-prolyl isomerase GldI [uncultured Maribacter sp.]